MKYPEKEQKKGGAEGYIKSNNKRRILGPECSMSEVGTPPPNNSDKPHGLVDSINNNNNNNNNNTQFQFHFCILNLSSTNYT